MTINSKFHNNLHATSQDNIQESSQKTKVHEEIGKSKKPTLLPSSADEKKDTHKQGNKNLNELISDHLPEDEKRKNNKEKTRKKR